MKKLFVIVTFFVVAAAAWPQQSWIRLHTNPKLPSSEALERLDLIMVWRARLPMDGLRDGFFSLQLIPAKDFPLLLAQTYRGDVIAINAETGDTLWRTPVGQPYKDMVPPGTNNQTLFTSRKSTLYALGLHDGKQLLYTSLPGPDVPPAFGFEFDAVPMADMTATEGELFVTFGDRVIAVVVPDLRQGLKLDPKDFELAQPFRIWTFAPPGNVRQRPLVFGESVVAVADNGTAVFLDRKKGEPQVVFKTGGQIVAPAAVNKSSIYLPCMDYYLYALDAGTGQLTWRFAGQAPILDSPTATDADVFVVVSTGGLHRLDAANGEPKWSNKDAVRFLAANRQFVYALDRVGNTLVLDYHRGRTMAVWDTRDWVVPLANDLTDRIYLASHDGQIMCLRHRENAKPMQHRLVEPIIPKKKDEEKKDVDKGGDDKINKDKGGRRRQTPAPWLAAREAAVQVFNPRPLTNKVRQLTPDFWPLTPDL
jgi:outer membrane protein assembly factor BamB